MIMEKRNKIIIAIALLVAAAVLIAGATALLSPKENDKGTTIRIGVLPVIDTLPLYVGVEQKLFADRGVNVELVEFNSAMERDAAFTSGSIDGYFGDLVNTLVIAKSTDVKVVTVDYHTLADHRMFAILASPGSGITDLSQLNGSDIATSRASVSEYIMLSSCSPITTKITNRMAATSTALLAQDTSASSEYPLVIAMKTGRLANGSKMKNSRVAA